jgi:hypothetical protein
VSNENRMSNQISSKRIPQSLKIKFKKERSFLKVKFKKREITKATAKMK